MRKAISGTFVAAAMIAAPAAAATIVMLPAPGSMDGPRVFVGDGDPDEIYVCSFPTEPGGGRCSLHHARPRGRR
jgi:hypothetical protein